MAVRLREADNMAAMAELQQQISELEIQVNPTVAALLINANMTVHAVMEKQSVTGWFHAT